MYQIIWSNTARNTYKEITDFIIENWSIDVILNLDGKVQTLLDKLKKLKHLCPALKSMPELRKCVISRQTSIIYTIDEHNKIIKIVSFIDNRMNHRF